MMSSSLLFCMQWSVGQGRPPVIRLDLYIYMYLQLSFLYANSYQNYDRYENRGDTIQLSTVIKATNTTWIHAPLSPNHGSTPYLVSRRNKGSVGFRQKRIIIQNLLMTHRGFSMCQSYCSFSTVV